MVGMAAEVSNGRSLRCAAKTGLTPWRDFEEEGKPYRYFVLRIPEKPRQHQSSTRQA